MLFFLIFLTTYRGPGPLEAQTPGDDPLVRGEGEQQEPGRGLPPRHSESDACVTARDNRDRVNCSIFTLKQIVY